MGTGKMDFLVSLWRFRAMRDTKKSTFPVPTGTSPAGIFSKVLV